MTKHATLNLSLHVCIFPISERRRAQIVDHLIKMHGTPNVLVHRVVETVLKFETANETHKEINDCVYQDSNDTLVRKPRPTANWAKGCVWVDRWVNVGGIRGGGAAAAAAVECDAPQNNGVVLAILPLSTQGVQIPTGRTHVDVQTREENAHGDGTVYCSMHHSMHHLDSLHSLSHFSLLDPISAHAAMPGAALLENTTTIAHPIVVDANELWDPASGETTVVLKSFRGTGQTHPV